MLRIVLACLLPTLALSPATAANWKWDFDENFVGGGVADATWTIDKVFPGTKLIVDMRFVPKSKLHEPGEKWQEEEYWATVEADMQWGKGETGLEYGVFSVNTYSKQLDLVRPTNRRLRAVRDQIELLTVQIGWDDPLGVESYTELTAARVGRSWDWRSSQQSRFSIRFGVKASLGWLWADSFNPNYRDVSNPFTGFNFALGLSHDTFGTLYTDDRIVQGFTFSSPARGGATGREARIRFGYYKRFNNCIALDLFVEKRSFNFSDAVIPDLYTKSKRTGGMLYCMFGDRGK